MRPTVFKFHWVCPSSGGSDWPMKTWKCEGGKTGGSGTETEPTWHGLETDPEGDFLSFLPSPWFRLGFCCVCCSSPYGDRLYLSDLLANRNASNFVELMFNSRHILPLCSTDLPPLQCDSCSRTWLRIGGGGGGGGPAEAHPSRVPMTNLGIVIILWELIIWNARPMASHFEPAGPNKRWKSYRWFPRILPFLEAPARKFCLQKLW